MAVPASLANSRTMPTVVRLSKIASRIACSSTAATWMLSFTPWWNSIVNSVSPSSRAMAAVELKAPAASADRDTVSSDREAPPRARSCPLRSMRSASIAPDSPRKCRRTPLIRCASSSWMAMLSFRLIERPLFLSEPRDEEHARHRVQRVEDPFALDRDRLEVRDSPAPAVQQVFEVFDRCHVGQVPLVVLDDVRDLIKIVTVLFEILLQVSEAFDVFPQPVPLRIGDEDDAIDTAQDKLAGHVVVHLPRDGVELELRYEVPDRHRRDGQEVEEERAVVAGGQRHHVAPVHVGQAPVDVLKVGGLARDPGAVVHDLEADLFLRVVDDRHRRLRPGPASRSYARPGDMPGRDG